MCFCEYLQRFLFSIGNDKEGPRDFRSAMLEGKASLVIAIEMCRSLWREVQFKNVL